MANEKEMQVGKVVQIIGAVVVSLPNIASAARA